MNAKCWRTLRYANLSHPTHPSYIPSLFPSAHRTTSCSLVCAFGFSMVPAHSCSPLRGCPYLHQPTETDRNEVICLPNVVNNATDPRRSMLTRSIMRQLSYQEASQMILPAYSSLFSSFFHRYCTLRYYDFSVTFFHTSPRKAFELQRQKMICAT